MSEKDIPKIAGQVATGQKKTFLKGVMVIICTHLYNVEHRYKI